MKTSILVANLSALLEGALTTILLATTAYVIGAGLGAIACAMTRQPYMSLQVIARTYIDFFRTVPELVPIIWLYACAPFIFKVDLSPTTVGVVAFALITGASFAEILRTGLDAVSESQRDAGRALGLREWVIFWKIILPQTVVVALPPSLNLYSDIVKISSLLSLIGVAELAYETAILSAATYRYLEFYTMAGIIYLVMIVTINQFATMIGRRYAQKASRKST